MLVLAVLVFLPPQLLEEGEGALYSEGIFRYPRKKDVVSGKQKIF